MTVGFKKRICFLHFIIFRIVPGFGDHLTDAVIGCLHGVAVGISHFLEASVAVLVGVVNEFFRLALNADGLQVVERIVGKGILHAVATKNKLLKNRIDINNVINAEKHI